MIYSRFGGVVRIVRLASEQDHKDAGETPIRASDRERMRQECRVVFAYAGDGTPENPKDDGKVRVADVSYLRADEGWSEIQAAIEAVKAKS